MPRGSSEVSNRLPYPMWGDLTVLYRCSRLSVPFPVPYIPLHLPIVARFLAAARITGSQSTVDRNTKMLNPEALI